MDWKVYFTKMATKINKIKSSMGQWRLSCRCQYNHWIERRSSYYSLKKRSTTFVKSVFELSLFEAEYTPSHILNTPHVGQTVSNRTEFVLLFFILPCWLQRIFAQNRLHPRKIRWFISFLI
jgi:hypothetical protein